ncbi:LysR family transcriptional regulator [Klebsiella pneumoniae]|uniref:LysR family transcriptional regulator n=1 Tax=Klebsiella pneumoniae TaxID=573 RepID=A0A447S8P0_KLEPN|nr:LysR family transcriptional regulator [Klebsiella pneumoniae]
MLNPQTSRELQVRAFAEMNMGIVVAHRPSAGQPQRGAL